MIDADILLIHGAWHGKWCWAPLQVALQNLGVHAHAIDLPGHGERRRNAWLTTWPAYERAVCDAARSFVRPPVLVGHSMGGGVITGAAERAPELFRALAYVAAFVPVNGDSIAKLAGGGGGRPKGLVARPLRGDASFTAEAAIDTFFHDCQDAGLWAAQLQPQALRPVTSRIGASDQRWGMLPRHYVYAEQDRAIPFALQQSMARRVGMTSEHTMNCGHSPFLADPVKLAGILAEIARPTRGIHDE